MSVADKRDHVTFLYKNESLNMEVVLSDPFKEQAYCQTEGILSRLKSGWQVNHGMVELFIVVHPNLMLQSCDLSPRENSGACQRA